MLISTFLSSISLSSFKAIFDDFSALSEGILGVLAIDTFMVEF